MSNDLKNKKGGGTPQMGRLFSENTTCGDYPHTTWSDFDKNLGIALNRIGSKIRDAVDREYFRVVNPKFYKRYFENEEKTQNTDR